MYTDGKLKDKEISLNIRYICPWSVLLTQYCAGDKIEKNEMGWVCGTYGWGEGGVQGLGGEAGGKETNEET